MALELKASASTFKNQGPSDLSHVIARIHAQMLCDMSIFSMGRRVVYFHVAHDFVWEVQDSETHMVIVLVGKEWLLAHDSRNC